MAATCLVAFEIHLRCVFWSRAAFDWALPRILRPHGQLFPGHPQPTGRARKRVSHRYQDEMKDGIMPVDCDVCRDRAPRKEKCKLDTHKDRQK